MKLNATIGSAALSAAVLATGASAQHNGYARFDQSTDTIRVYGNTAFSGVESTYEMRVRISSDAGAVLGHVISEQRDAYEAKSVRLSDRLFQKETVRGYVCGNENNHEFGIGALADWHHLAWVRDGAVARLYIDGQLAATWNEQNNCTADSSDSTMSIGMFRNGSPCCWGDALPSFIGDLDWIRISSGARYTGSFAPPYECEVLADQATQLLLKFNEPAGTTTLIDESSGHFECVLGVPVQPGVTASSPSLGNPVYGSGSSDPCSSYLVPDEYATIQAAIDAVPAGEHGLVLVAAGTRNESFSLIGKDVIVRGAPSGDTVLDGTGLTTSIATFTGSEPATAGLDGLVFRNGTAGARIYKGAKFTVGGAVYGRDSAAFIRGCRFEQNRADFGGAVYMLHCAADVSGCVFSGNAGRTDGGALMLYECAGSVRTSDFTANACAIAGSGNGGAFKSVGGLTEGALVTLEDCTVSATTSGSDGAAVHHFENLGFGVSGVLRIVGTDITGNSTVVGAGGVSVDGRQSSCVLAGGSAVCANLPRNIEGAYLIDGSATVCDCQADVTGDGAVNGADLGIVLNSWGLADAQGTGDVNHDGVVDGADLGEMLSAWGACG